MKPRLPLLRGIGMGKIFTTSIRLIAKVIALFTIESNGKNRSYFCNQPNTNLAAQTMHFSIILSSPRRGTKVRKSVLLNICVAVEMYSVFS